MMLCNKSLKNIPEYRVFVFGSRNFQDWHKKKQNNFFSSDVVYIFRCSISDMKCKIKNQIFFLQCYLVVRLKTK